MVRFVALWVGVGACGGGEPQETLLVEGGADSGDPTTVLPPTGGTTTGSASTPGTTTPGGSGQVGCHLDCECLEPPFHPAEIDCAAACATIDGICDGDPGCWACPYYGSADECRRSCDGIAATWGQQNLATYIADVVYGCASQNGTCGGMTQCNDEIYAQQDEVCP